MRIKKSISIILSLTMIFGLMSFPVNATETATNFALYVSENFTAMGNAAVTGNIVFGKSLDSLDDNVKNSKAFVNTLYINNDNLRTSMVGSYRNVSKDAYSEDYGKLQKSAIINAPSGITGTYNNEKTLNHDIKVASFSSSKTQTISAPAGKTINIAANCVTLSSINVSGSGTVNIYAGSLKILNNVKINSNATAKLNIFVFGTGSHGVSLGKFDGHFNLYAPDAALSFQDRKSVV